MDMNLKGYHLFSAERWEEIVRSYITHPSEIQEIIGDFVMTVIMNYYDFHCANHNVLFLCNAGWETHIREKSGDVVLGKALKLALAND